MPSVIGTWVDSLLHYAAKQGVARSMLLGEAGIAGEALERADARVSTTTAGGIWDATRRRVGDADFGLHFAEQVGAATFGVVGYLGHASPTVGDALDVIVRFHKLVNTAGSKEHSVAGDTVEVRPRHGTPRLPVGRQLAEASFAYPVVLGRRWAFDGLAPLAVHFAHARPARTTEHDRIFRCPVLFDQPANRILFHRDIYERKLKGADQGLARILEASAHAQVGALPAAASFLDELRGAVADAIHAGAPSLEAVARRIGMGERTVQRRLQDLGVSYRALLDDVRRGLALELLGAGDLSIAEVGYRLGYSGESAFRRSFRRWTTSSPRKFRGARPS